MNVNPHAPTETSDVKRRSVLKTMVAVLAQAGLLAVFPTHSIAEQSINASDFLALSKALTGHPGLNDTMATRLYDALRKADSGFIARAFALAKLVHAGQTPQQLLADADKAGLQDTVHAIVAAWYTGTVGHGQHAVMVAYADALMYGTVGDGMSPPTYCANGPLWWVAEPPPANVAPPRARTASEARPHQQA
ncbi:hypothetical protein PI86_08430 [Burkholderia sp. A9]|nr:hypothetical protein PI86_08430 [Burkholderia sp. A9]